MLQCCSELRSTQYKLYGGLSIVLAINGKRPTHKHQYQHMVNVGQPPPR